MGNEAIPLTPSSATFCESTSGRASRRMRAHSHLTPLRMSLLSRCTGQGLGFRERSSSVSSTRSNGTFVIRTNPGGMWL